MTTPDISVIVVCRNPGPLMHEALESVWAQTGVTVDLVVIDGASSDGTREWLESQRARISTLVSEPDGGIYDAMNKGIAAARGEWLLFLGADDRLVRDRVLAEALEWARKTEAGVIAGEAAYDDGRIYRLHRRIKPLARNFVHHQSALYRRGLFAENGTFDPTLRLMADYDFNLRLWRAHVRFKPIPLRFAACRSRGASDGGAWRVYREEMTVRHRHFPAWRCWGWDLISVLRYIRKQAVLRRSPRHG